MKFYTIKEYDRKTKKYITIGEVRASSSDLAKLKFIQETGWESARDTCLFVEVPICR